MHILVWGSTFCLLCLFSLWYSKLKFFVDFYLVSVWRICDKREYVGHPCFCSVTYLSVYFRQCLFYAVEQYYLLYVLLTHQHTPALLPFLYQIYSLLINIAALAYFWIPVAQIIILRISMFRLHVLATQVCFLHSVINCLSLLIKLASLYFFTWGN